MGADETFRLAPDAEIARAAAETLFATVSRQLISSLPASAQVLHVGATAIPGCLTKGDLDIVVRVVREDFAGCDAVLATSFERNSGSIRTGEFAAFENSKSIPHLGVQLTVKGSAFDTFHFFSERLRQNPALLRRYNDLKLRYDGKPMRSYRAAKDAFIDEALGS